MIKQFARGLADRSIRGRNLNVPEERAQAGTVEGWVSLSCNLCLALAKFIFGLLTGSVSLMADAVHTASDISSSLVVLCGFKISGIKPDREHPFGHGRVEYLAGLVMAVMLIGAGLSFVYTAIVRMLGGASVNPSLPAIMVILCSILLKHLMYHFSLRLAERIGSEAILGSAWHHRSDSFSSAVVMVAFIGSYYGIYILDAVLGAIVAILVIHTGVQIARKSVNRLLGTPPSQEVNEGILSCALAVEGVINAHDLEVHDYGFLKSITLHVEVDGSLNLCRAHEIASRVEHQISKRYHCNTVIHIDPSPSSPGAPSLSTALNGD